ncbi:hypothetical protein E2562_034726 [Oryza meyeriana var. granulata]|uniref:Uncharacterized protein n=1 Tax=Oryza meyeriana var. granulata TaxID=110450 RepID=A0A6G1C9T0_9ORYZ|nr:hypothetical protein E2562_034726 [Oryza meyeriana var. granulata]
MVAKEIQLTSQRREETFLRYVVRFASLKLDGEPHASLSQDVDACSRASAARQAVVRGQHIARPHLNRDRR